jgi:pimeloyl-ACP methyl ester carboxylesterase
MDLVFDMVEQTTDLVERTHDGVVERSARRFAPVRNSVVKSTAVKSTVETVTGIQMAISGGVFESIRVINGITRVAVSAIANVAEVAATALATPIESTAPETPGASRAARTASRYVDYAQASLNGFWGDSLSRRNSRLDLGMTLRHPGRQSGRHGGLHEGQPLPVTPEALSAAYPNATNKICVFVHSLAATEWLWSRSSEKHYGEPSVSFGTQLCDDLGFTPIYLRYNTGRHISENGRALATLLSELLDAYPVPVEEIALVGHSMGGLVARSAAHYGREIDEPWVAHLRHVACIGSPHLGAPLEKGVNLLTGVLRKIDAAGAQVPAELLDSRSVGVKDLRYGYTIDEEWAGKDPDEVFADSRRNVPLVDGVGYYFLAATISRNPGNSPGNSHGHPPGQLFGQLLGQLVGDMIVRLPSATGAASEPARRIQFSSGAVFPGMNHLHMADHPRVYEALRDLLAP